MYTRRAGLVAGSGQRAGAAPAKAGLSFTPAMRRPARVARAQEIPGEKFTGMGWLVPRAILDAMPAAQRIYFDSFCQVHMDGGGTGAAVLIGTPGNADSS